MIEWNYTFASIQITSASISLVASLATAIMIYRSLGGLSLPYQRIIFGLSIADALQSYSLVVGPFSVSHELERRFPWAIGNFYTCQANAVTLTGGFIGVPIYTFLLCVYYLCKAKYSMTNEEFLNKIELKAHLFIVLSFLLTSIIAISTKAYNPLPAGSSCSIAPYPPGCMQFPEVYGDCSRGAISSRLLLFVIMVGQNIIVIPSAVVTALKLYFYVKSKEMMFRAEVIKANRTELPLNTDSVIVSSPQSFGQKVKSFFGTRSNRGEDDRQPHETRAKYIARLYRREAMIQAGLYLTAFYGIYSVGLFIGLTNSVEKMKHMKVNGLLVATAVIYPLGGLFNVLIYSRPKVALLRRKCPWFPWIQCQWMVLQAGCELPSQEKLDETAVWFHWCCKKARRAPEDTLSNSSISVKFSPRQYCSSREIEEYLDGGESVQAFNGCSALVGEEINYDEVCSIAGSGT